MEKLSHAYQRWRSFLNEGKRYYVRSALLILALMLATVYRRWPSDGWELLCPSVFTAIFALRATEEKTKKTWFDCLCPCLWLAENAVLLLILQNGQHL